MLSHAIGFLVVLLMVLRLTFNAVILICQQPNTGASGLACIKFRPNPSLARISSCVKPWHLFIHLSESLSDRLTYLITWSSDIIFFFWILECVHVYWPWVEGLCESRVSGWWSHFIHSNSGCFWWWEKRGWKVGWLKCLPLSWISLIHILPCSFPIFCAEWHIPLGLRYPEGAFVQRQLGRAMRAIGALQGLPRPSLCVLEDIRVGNF